MAMGRVIHYAVDLTLFAGFMAGVKKNTGLAPNVRLIGEPNVEYYILKYLDFGDYIYDSTVDLMKTSRFCVKN